MGEVAQKAFPTKAGLKSEFLTLARFSVESSFLRFGFAQTQSSHSRPVVKAGATGAPAPPPHPTPLASEVPFF